MALDVGEAEIAEIPIEDICDTCTCMHTSMSRNGVA